VLQAKITYKALETGNVIFNDSIIETNYYEMGTCFMRFLPR